MSTDLAQQVNLLLVEDNPMDARLLRAYLEEGDVARFKLTHAMTFAEALKFLDTNSTGFDAIMLDMSLPDSDGVVSVQNMHQRVPDLPIVVMTGHDDVQIGVSAVQEGAQDYLIKGKVDGQLITRSIFHAIERQRILTELKTLKNRMERELHIARVIQQQLLPDKVPEVQSLRIHGEMITAKEVGGDFFAYIPPDAGEEDPIFVCIGDVSGKGVGAGLIMVMTRAAVHAAVENAENTHGAMVEVNYILKADVPAGMFVSMMLLKWDPKESKLFYTGAGFEKPMIYRAESSEVEILDGAGIVLGVVADASDLLKEKSVTLNSGDTVLLYSDGVTEAMNTNSEEFSIERLQQVFAAYGQGKPNQIVDRINKTVRAYTRGATQHDDITLVVLQRS